MRKFALFCIIICFLCSLAVPVLCAGGYEPVYLGTLGGKESWALGINGKGAVVGCSLDGQGKQRPFIWTQDGKMQPLETLGGENAAAVCINDDGEIAGYSDTPEGQRHAWLKTLEGKTTDIDVLAGDNTSQATFIRDLIVGWSSIDDKEYHAFVWSVDNLITPLPGPTPQDQAQAFGVNKSGTAVGAIRDSSTAPWRAVCWRSDGTVSLQDTGELGKTSSVAYAINDAGIIVGEATDDLNQVHAFCWVPPYAAQKLQLPRGIGATHARATCINNANLIGGWVDGKQRRAVVWDLGSELGDKIKVKVTALPLLPGTLTSEVTAINDNGTVVGFCVAGNGQKRAVMWRPVRKDVYASFALVGGVFMPVDAGTRDRFSKTWMRVGLKPFERDKRTMPHFSAESGAFRFNGPTDIDLYEISAGVEKGLTPTANVQSYLAFRGGPYWGKMTDNTAGTSDTNVGLNLNASYGLIFRRNVYAELRYDYFSRFAGVEMSGLSLSVGFRLFDLRR